MNFDISVSITYFNTYFISAKQVANVCNNSVYVLDYSANKMIQFDNSWNYVKVVNFYYPIFMIAINTNDYGVSLFLINLYGIYCFDTSINLINSYINYNAQYTRMHYNSTSGYLYVLSKVNKTIDVFTDELAFVKSISISPYIPVDIDEYNDLLYVAVSLNINSSILALQNDLIVSIISTTCSSITSLKIDQYGNIAIVCSNDIISIYSINDKTFSNISWISAVANINDIEFDSNGNLVLTAQNGIFLINNQTQIAKSAVTAISDTNCILNSK